MRNAKTPSGPGKPTEERRDATSEREQIDEMTDEAQGRADDPGRDPSTGARQAERDAHVKGTNPRTGRSTSRDQRR